MADQPTDLRTVIGTVMGEVLTRGQLEPDEDFFEAGGDSLRAIEVLQRLGAHPAVGDRLGTTEMQAQLLEAIFETPSPAGLSSFVTANA
jgi:aryl carrier-like protein